MNRTVMAVAMSISMVSLAAIASADTLSSTGRTNVRAPSLDRLEAPAGTQVLVRTVETIDSRTVAADQAFAAIVERDVTGKSGEVIIPQGAGAQLMLRQLSSRGPTGSPDLALDIQSIMIRGRRYMVSTAYVTLDIGTGLAAAALGTIIGANAGGGKGASIGVVVVVGPAGGAPLLTRGRDVRVPAETVLIFRLDRPVMLQTGR